MKREPTLAFSVSFTTRPRRPNEVEGRDYHFVSAGKFLEMVAERRVHRARGGLRQPLRHGPRPDRLRTRPGTGPDPGDRLAGCAAGAGQAAGNRRRLHPAAVPRHPRAAAAQPADRQSRGRSSAGCATRSRKSPTGPSSATWWSTTISIPALDDLTAIVRGQGDGLPEAIAPGWPNWPPACLAAPIHRVLAPRGAIGYSVRPYC